TTLFFLWCTDENGSAATAAAMTPVDGYMMQPEPNSIESTISKVRPTDKYSPPKRKKPSKKLSTTQEARVLSESSVQTSYWRSYDFFNSPKQSVKKLGKLYQK